MKKVNYLIGGALALIMGLNANIALAKQDMKLSVQLWSLRSQ